MPQTGKGKSGARKYGRNKAKCEKYQREHHYEKNKIRRLTSMITRLSVDNKMRIQNEERIRQLQEII